VADNCITLIHQVSNKRQLWKCGNDKSNLVGTGNVSNQPQGRRNKKAEVWTRLTGKSKFIQSSEEKIQKFFQDWVIRQEQPGFRSGLPNCTQWKGENLERVIMEAPVPQGRSRTYWITLRPRRQNAKVGWTTQKFVP